MRVLLVGAELEENLPLRYLGAALEQAGHSTFFAKFDGRADAGGVLDAVASAQPDLVGMSMTFQFRAKEFGALADLIRRDGYRGHITAGGHFPTFAFRECLDAFPAIDTIVRHEGEITLVELCDALTRAGIADSRGLDDAERSESERGRVTERLATVRGLAYRASDGTVHSTEPRPLIEDLDSLPFPKRVGDPQLHLGIPAAFLVGTRGCFGHCTFCCIHAYLKSAGGQMYRWRSPENVADEMAELRRTRGARMFVFHDDDFFTRDHERDYARMVALRDALRARGVSDVAVVVKARPDDVDERVFSVLQQIGLLRVYLGVEAGSTQGLRVLGRGVDMTENRRALDFLRERDVYTCFNMLVFDPESTLESLRESFAFLREYSDVPMNFCRTEIYVGTPLMTKLAREKRLVGDVFGWDYALRDPSAERAFRVFAQAFLDRNFRCDGLMNSTLGLGYHLHLLRTFYPHAMTPALRALATEATRAVNLDCNDKMVEILDFAAEERSTEPTAFEDFAARMTEKVARATRELESRVAAATDSILRAAAASTPRSTEQARAKPQRTAFSKWGALSAATLALAPLAACEKTASPPPPDPLPIPTLVSGPPDAGGQPYVQPNDPVPTPMTAPPPDPPPPPVMTSATPLSIDAGSGAGKRKQDAGARPHPPPPDPLPPPTIRPVPPPPDPLPRPYTK